MEFKSLTIEEMNVGDQVSKEFYVDELMGTLFAEVSSDFNPIHLDNQYASETPFKQRIAHGMLIASFISAVIGTEIPGVGTIYAMQDLQFKKPVYYNQTVEVIITVVSIEEKKNRVELRTQCIDKDKQILVDGCAIVLPKKKKEVKVNGKSYI